MIADRGYLLIVGIGATSVRGSSAIISLKTNIWCPRGRDSQVLEQLRRRYGRLLRHELSYLRDVPQHAVRGSRKGREMRGRRYNILVCSAERSAGRLDPFDNVADVDRFRRGRRGYCRCCCHALAVVHCPKNEEVYREPGLFLR